MSRIEWNKAGERFFETGVNQGVLYPKVGPGVAWNGLVSVNESSSGGDLEPLYFDGVKYADIPAGEDFQATIEAFNAPPQFAISEGVKYLAPGLAVSQQPRKTFGFSYRTLVGNDLVASDYGYKIHVVYNCTAAPSGRTNSTIAATVSPGTRSWTINTVPLPATTFRPTAHVVLEAWKIPAAKLEEIEGGLYGMDGVAPWQLSIEQILSVINR